MENGSRVIGYTVYIYGCVSGAGGTLNNIKYSK